MVHLEFVDDVAGRGLKKKKKGQFLPKPFITRVFPRPTRHTALIAECVLTCACPLPSAARRGPAGVPSGALPHGARRAVSILAGSTAGTPSSRPGASFPKIFAVRINGAAADYLLLEMSFRVHLSSSRMRPRILSGVSLI